MAEIRDGSGAGLIMFLEWSKEKGVIAANTVGAMISTSTKVLEIDGDLDSIKVDEIDVENLFNRFVTLHGSKYSSGSLATYQARFTRALELYEAYRDDPINFKGPTPRKRANSKLDDTRKQTSSTAATNNGGVESSGHGGALISYPFPLRTGQIAHLRLPPKLATSDAKRLANFIESVALDDQLALPQSNERDD